MTDFEELSVYDCQKKPVKTDKASHSRILYFTYSEYADRWEEFAEVFSRDAILKGSFDKYVESKKAKKGTAEVDDAFLEEIERWRSIIARNIALRNSGLNFRELNFAVQRTIDRIIFLRICEDRGIETYGKLMALRNGNNVYKRLLEIFQQADDMYNSGLFHFRKEKGRPDDYDALTPGLVIDDNVLKEIFKNLYYPDSPYEFSVLPADILGHVYEQFLGKVIRLTAGHRAVVEEKPEVRKAGGVYYTPTYIVDYTVKQTVGRLLKDKKPGPNSTASKIKILDPACGSGSFLIGAYQFLLDWHLDGYINDDPQKWSRGRSPQIYQATGGEWKLTIDERKRILVDNIYGVDIDAQAVEVTKLSLLLKVIEGRRQLSLFRERVLPDLGNNIKCGNSLIGPDYYERQQLSFLDEEEMYRINVFDWASEFSEIMKGGGFDAVIGNPPYVRQESLTELKEYFQKNYSIYHGIADLYSYFIEKGVSLLKSQGVFSYIVSNKWMRANYGKPLRKWMRSHCIEEIVDFGDLPVFKRVSAYPCILRISNKKPADSFRSCKVKDLDFQDLAQYVVDNHYKVNQEVLGDQPWSLVSEKAQALLEKLEKLGMPLGQYVDGKIYYGIKTGLNKAFVIDHETRQRIISEDAKSEELIKPFLAGRDIKRYLPPQNNRYLILIPKGWTRTRSGGAGDAWVWLKGNYPSIAAHLAGFEEDAKKRYDKGEYWWELRACDYYAEFEKAKIIIPAIVNKASYAFDVNGFYSNDKTSIIQSDDLYILGLLNSKAIDFYLHHISSTKQGGYLNTNPCMLSNCRFTR